MTKAHPDEGDVKDFVKKEFKKRGWKVWSPPANQFGASGSPDIHGLHRSVFVVVETKCDKTTGTPLQEEWLVDARDHGGFAVLINRHNQHFFGPWLDAVDKTYGRDINPKHQGDSIPRLTPTGRTGRQRKARSGSETGAG